MSARDWALLTMLSILWGGSFLFAKIAVTEIPALTVVLGRVGIAALVLALVLVVSGARLPRGGAIWAAFFGMGLLNNVIPFSLMFWGQKELAAGLGAILNATTPLFTVIVAHVWTADEKMTPSKIAGVIVGFAGVAAMIGPSAFAGMDRTLLAQLAFLGGTLSYAFAGVFGRRFKAMGATPMQTAFGQLAASTLMTIPLVAALEPPWPMATPSARALIALVLLAVICTALAYIIYFQLLASAGATNLLLVTFLIPVSAIWLGALVLGERLEPRHFLGMAMIGLGLAAIDGRLWKRWRAPARIP